MPQKIRFNYKPFFSGWGLKLCERPSHLYMCAFIIYIYVCIFFFRNSDSFQQKITLWGANLYIYTGWNDKIVVLKKTTLQLYFKTFIEKINSGNLIM